MAIPSHLSISDLDLTNKHILWASITSAGVALPLPLDSCCSLSLVSKAHAEIIAQKHPQLTFTKLQSPLPVAVANPSSQLTAIGAMQVPIIWGKWSSFHLFYACCAGACLADSFGQNHLCKTQAHTNHAALQVYFADPQLTFTVKRRDANPLDAFPSLRNQPSSSASQGSPSTHVTCLLTAMPTPSHHSSHIRLHRGFNLVALCLMMTAALLGSTMFSSPHWLEGNEISPGVRVVSGPVDLNSISSVLSFDDPLFHHHEGHNYPKCRPSHMLLEYEPPLVQAGVLISPTQPLGTGNVFNTGDALEFSQKFYTTVVIKSTRDHIVLPHNANLGSIQPMSADHNEDFSDAADHTAHTLADTWLTYGKHRLMLPNIQNLLQDLRHNLPVPLLPLGLGLCMLR